MGRGSDGGGLGGSAEEEGEESFSVLVFDKGGFFKDEEVF